jgi:hypothetical protein
MGQYKVPQNVEAEDKILGPLTLKQFIYVIVGLGWGFVTFSLFRSVPVLFVVVGIPVSMLFLLLGLYQPQDQPFEARFLAMVSYFGKPRKRLWEKEPIFEIFRVEATPAPAEMPTKDINQMRGKLEQLVRVVDTRGIQAKNAALQEPHPGHRIDLESRLVMPDQPAQPAFATATQLQQQQPEHEITLADDILDFQNNPSAQNLNELIENTTKDIRQEALARMKTRPQPQATTNAVAPSIPPDILKLATEGELKVSQLAAQAQRQTLTEGQAVNLRNATTTSQ